MTLYHLLTNSTNLFTIKINHAFKCDDNFRNSTSKIEMAQY